MQKKGAYFKLLCNFYFLWDEFLCFLMFRGLFLGPSLSLDPPEATLMNLGPQVYMLG